MVKRRSVKRKRTKREDEEPEDLDEDLDLDEEEEDEEEEERPRRKKKRPRKVAAARDEDEDEDEDDDSDSFFRKRRSKKDRESLLSDPSRVEEGEYELKVGKMLKPRKLTTKDNTPMVIHAVALHIVDGPGDEPETGWPAQKFEIVEWKQPSKGQRQAMQISERSLWRLITACVGEKEVDSDDDLSPFEMLDECRGATVLADAYWDSYGQGRQRWRNFRPA